VVLGGRPSCRRLLRNHFSKIRKQDSNGNSSKTRAAEQAGGCPGDGGGAPVGAMVAWLVVALLLAR